MDVRRSPYDVKITSVTVRTSVKFTNFLQVDQFNGSFGSAEGCGKR